ncbi:unnamed protein product [Camellia sinensis]
MVKNPITNNHAPACPPMLAAIGDSFCNKIIIILQMKPNKIQAKRIPNDIACGGFEFKANCNDDPSDLKITIAMVALKFVTRSGFDSLSKLSPPLVFSVRISNQDRVLTRV